MLRNGAFDPIPDILSGENVKFKFDLPVNKIKKQVQSAAASQWALEVLQMAQIAPEARHLINVDALARFKANAASLPHDIMNTKEEVQQKVAAENAQKQQMIKLEMAEKAAGAAQKGATAMDKAGLIQPRAALKPGEAPVAGAGAGA